MSLNSRSNYLDKQIKNIDIAPTQCVFKLILGQGVNNFYDKKKENLNRRFYFFTTAPAPTGRKSIFCPQYTK